MSTAAKKVTITYADVVHSINAPEVQEDLDNACEQMALTALRLIENFDFITKQLHTIDLLRLSSPFNPHWISLRKQFMDILWHFRSNAGFISGRLKMFCTVVLPLAARNISTSRAYDEKLQVLKSFVNISADHASITRNLAGNAMKFNHALNTFHTDFLKFVSERAVTGQRELRELSQKLTELESEVRQ
ncbi:hypothetical protein H0H81_003917 [Sphagnurus paluster]|uniref:Uncharacterized protein n=1 Tax=Sphagnurus paluster TaxID=117069 RepID=A0A9P7GHM1_9AGAR|nr:hypothetical protein H0H81_003917 [Sphagnurus paluster]